MADSKIQLTSLDFDTIKQNLKNYLKDQSEFADFDFEGSSINILLDVLAYNTFYNSFYLNMAANEMFLDTAVMRPSVVSHAKLLGYTPRSAVASQVFANVTITRTDTTSILNIPAYTQFAAKGPDGASYSFYTVTDTEYVSNNGNNFNFVNVLMKEGMPVIKTFEYSKAANPNQYFDLTDANIDLSTLKVVVQNSISNPAYTVFTLAEDATEVTTTSPVYYVEETQTGSHRIYFGDGVIGRQLNDGNIVGITYLKTNADLANGCNNFTLQSTVLAGSTSVVTTTQKSNGGSQPETISDIKFAAPKSFISQNRAVTKNDYIALVNKKYPYFDSVTVWGGEEENPPVYGKIYISAKPKQGFVVSKSQQEYLLKTVLKPISILTVTPEFVDADYNYMNFTVNVTYDPKKTTLSSTELATKIRAAVVNFANTNLNTFNASFHYSKLIKTIDTVDQSIQSTDSSIYLQKKFTPDLTRGQSYIIKYGVPLHRGTLNDRLYSSPYFLMADSSGAKQQCYIEEVPYSFGGVEEINIQNSGVNYTTTPKIIIEGDGQGANAYAIIVNGKINSVVVDNPGSDYTVATVTVSGGGGKNAALESSLTGSKGSLRIFYYNANKTKKILNSNAGTIYYSNGTVTLENFKPVDVASTLQVLSLYAKPDSTTLSSVKNVILTQDPNDSTSIIVNTLPVTS